jgi:hypothetical protein
VSLVADYYRIKSRKIYLIDRTGGVRKLGRIHAPIILMHSINVSLHIIDDRYLDEAISFSAEARGTRKSLLTSPVIRAVSGVAALAAVLSLVIFGASRGFLKSSDKHAPAESETSLSPSQELLDSLLQGCAESASFTPLSADELSLFDGTVRLIVQSPDSEALYVSRPLSAAEQANVSLEFEQAGRQIGESESSDTDWSVWISFGDGQILTPCLSPTPGNVGMGELFAYQSERLPSQAFFNLLNALI